MSAGAARIARDPLAALAWFLTLNLLPGAASVLLLVVCLRHVTPQDYGVLAAIGAIAAVYGMAANLKLDAAMRTFYFDHRADEPGLRRYLQQVFSAALLASAASLAVMLLVGDALFGIVFAHAEVEFIPAGAVALASASASACLASYFSFLRCGMHLRELTAWQTGLTVGTVALQILLVAYLGLGLYGVVLGSLIAAASALLALCVVRRDLLTLRVDMEVLKPSLAYVAPLFAVGIAYALATRLDRFVLERNLPLTDVGAYAALIAMFALLRMVLDAVDSAIRPRLQDSIRSGSADAAVRQYLPRYLLAGFAALAIVVLAGAQLQHVTSNAAYLAAQQWLLLGAIAYAPAVVARFYGLLCEARKQSKELSLASAARVVLLGALLFVLVPRYGVPGAFLALLVAESVNAAMFAWVVSSRLRIAPRGGAVAIGLFAYVAALLVVGAMTERL